MRRITFCLIIVILSLGNLAHSGERANKPWPGHGLYTLGLDDDGKIMSMPYIQGGRILVQWADLEVGKNDYNFDLLDKQLQKFDKLGMKATVQVNGSLKPRWLYNEVAVLEKENIQVKDPEGILQYWDPIYAEAYLAFIAAYGGHLKKSPYKDLVLGIRQNFNAIGTEHTSVKGEDADPKRWKPAPNGHVYNVPYSREVADDYRRQVVQAHIDAFCPDFVLFLRNNVYEELTEEQIAMLDDGRLGLFHTSSEAQPRINKKGGSDERKYLLFKKYGLSGKAPVYAEPWSPSESLERHGGGVQLDCTPAQFNYWRLLNDMQCGVSYIAMKPPDLLQYTNPEFEESFIFAGKYTGYHVSPMLSPGAWIALREGDSMKGDYTFLMERLADKSNDKPVKQAGPDEQRFGLWARKIDDDGQMIFRLNQRFAQSLDNAIIRITYLDEGNNSFRVEWDRNGSPEQKVVQKKDSGKWQQIDIAVENAEFTSSLDGGDVRLSSEGTTVFHMVEVSRENK